MRDRLPIAAAVAVLVAVAVAACGSSSSPSGNGVAGKAPDDIVTAATKAIGSVKSVRVSGRVADGPSRTPIQLDLNLVAGKGATGSMSENGLSFRLITVGGNAYINGSPSFWHQFGGSRAVSLLQGRWLKAPADHGQFASFSSLTDLNKLMAGLLGGHGALAKGDTSSLRGQKVIAVKDRSKGGTLYVATGGKPYPLRIANDGSRGGELDFTRFDAPVALKPPAQSIDITKLHK